MKKLIFALILLLFCTQTWAESFTVDYMGIEDATIQGGASLQKNYGATTTLYFGDSWRRYSVLFRVDITDSLLATDDVDSGYIAIIINAEALGADQKLILKPYSLLVNWGEGDNNGTTADAGECSGDSNITGTSAWNTDVAEGAGTDYNATAEDDGVHADSVILLDGCTTDTVYFWINQSTIKSWLTTNYGILVRYVYKSADGNYVTCRATEYAGDRPWAKFWYTPAGEEPTSQVIIIY